MIRTVSAVAAAALFVSATAANARCTSPTDETTFQLQGLKAELQVLTLSCKMDDRYNSFVRKFQSRLGQDERDFKDYFRRTFGGSAQREQDAYVTLLANAHAEVSIQQGSDYCQRTGMVFDELSAIPDETMLTSYVAGKDVVPVTAEACPGRAAPAAPTRRTARK